VGRRYDAAEAASSHVLDELKMRAWAGIGMLGVCCALLAGCETAPAPVSQRRVEEYRRTPAAPVTVKPAASEASAPTAAATPATSATKPATPKPASAPEVTAAAAAKTPATPNTATTPKLVPAPEVSAAPAAKAPTSKASANKTGPANEEEPEGDWRPEFYTVKRGDTVYSIALDAGLDYKELAAWNQLDDANVIRVGQQLRLRPPAGWKPEPADADAVVVRPAASQPPVESLPLEAPPPVKSAPKGIKVPYSDQALAQLTRDPGKASATEAKPTPEPKADAKPVSALGTGAAPTSAPLSALARPATSATVSTKGWEPTVPQDSARWIWPTSGKLLHPFNQGPDPKGVAIGGNLGQPIVASAAGKVVYSGSGLRGYGKLIIIKHDNTYLSVYAHNRELLVREGERVSKGQRIAEMGNIDSELVGLHFEIRRLGKPVDPLEYLPQNGAS
jgi:lipoprotein NlpD